MSTYSSVYSPSSAPADLEFIKYEKRGHIAIVTINRPEVRNALHTFASVSYTHLTLPTKA